MESRIGGTGRSDGSCIAARWSSRRAHVLRVSFLSQSCAMLAGLLMTESGNREPEAEWAVALRLALSAVPVDSERHCRRSAGNGCAMAPWRVSAVSSLDVSFPRRSLPGPACCILKRDSDTPVPEQGCTGASSDSAVREDHLNPRPRWPPASICRM